MNFMALTHTRISAEDFERFIYLPENTERAFELIGGEISEVVSNNYSSETAGIIYYFVMQHLRDSGIGGHLTTADGGYWVSGDRYMPDVGYISKARQPKPCHEAYNPLAPDLAVEVLSPTDSQKKLMDKVINYLAAGTIVLVVYPDDKEAAVYAPGKPVKKLSIDDVFDGGEILPGFKLAVHDMFPAEDA
jgi:Uma2 family endonuclease